MDFQSGSPKKGPLPPKPVVHPAGRRRFRRAAAIRFPAAKLEAAAIANPGFLDKMPLYSGDNFR